MGETTDLLIHKNEESQRQYLRDQPKCHLVETIMTLYEQLDKTENRVRSLELKNAVLQEEFKRAKNGN